MKTRGIILLSGLLVLASATAVAAAAPGTDARSAAVGVVEAPPAHVGWLSYEDGLALASREHKLVLVNFTADWCRYCRKMKKETYTDPQVAAYLAENFVPVMVDTERDRRLQYQYGASSLPTIWFLKSTGERITKLPGFVPAPVFLQVLRFIATGSYETMDFDAFVRQDKEG